METYKKILSEIVSLKGAGLIRMFLTSNEKKVCNQMIKLGYIYISKNDEKNATSAYYITKEGEEYLEQH